MFFPPASSHTSNGRVPHFSIRQDDRVGVNKFAIGVL
ncbi:hypothetical protein R3I94_015557 [Phoxinus phoxinus]